MRMRIDMTKRADVVNKVCTEFKSQLQDMVVETTIDPEYGSEYDVLIQLMREADDVLNDAIKKQVPESMFEEVISNE